MQIEFPETQQPEEDKTPSLGTILVSSCMVVLLVCLTMLAVMFTIRLGMAWFG